jgi:hypothetical protein
MPWPCKPRGIVFGVLLSALASSTLHALPVVPQARPQGRIESSELVTAAWDWLSSLFAPRPTTPKEPPANRSGQQKEGTQLDPNGGG